MSRRPLVAGNWKLHLGPVEARAFATELRAALLDVDTVDLAVFPTALSVVPVAEVLADTAIHVGLQWATAHASGAYTGRNSATHARQAGCGRLLVGHSEVRRDLGVDDAQVATMARTGLQTGLLPVICVGETLQERDDGRVEEVLVRQVTGALQELEPDEAATCTLAYEPVWAIGTGRTARPEQAQHAHALLRGWLSQHFPPFVAAQVRILYGGSVKPGNAAELLCQPDIDGALVGGASLDAQAFRAIVAAAAP